jgi:hypothetical protein
MRKYKIEEQENKAVLNKLESISYLLKNANRSYEDAEIGLLHEIEKLVNNSKEEFTIEELKQIIKTRLNY